jgi:hypothetical protein
MVVLPSGVDNEETCVTELLFSIFSVVFRGQFSQYRSTGSVLDLVSLDEGSDMPRLAGLLWLLRDMVVMCSRCMVGICAE